MLLLMRFFVVRSTKLDWPQSPRPGDYYVTREAAEHQRLERCLPIYSRHMIHLKNIITYNNLHSITYFYLQHDVTIVTHSTMQQ
jgi:hypothetical protein